MYQIARHAVNRRFIMNFSWISAFLLSQISVASTDVLLLPLKQEVCGALVREDFNVDALDPKKWRTVISHQKGIGVDIDQGELRFSGTLVGDPKFPLSSNFHQTTHIDTQSFRDRDVCLAVRMKMPSGVAATPGVHVINAHLCGVHPDTFAEVLYGRVDGAELGRMMKRHWGIDKRISKMYPGAINGPHQDAEGWWLAVSDADPWGASKVIGEPLPPIGNEGDQFHDVLVEYDEPTSSASAFIKLDSGWTQLGHPHRMVRGMSWVELKMYNFTETYGTYHEARFDDCRLYPHPKRHPIRVIVTEAGHPYPSPTLKFVLLTSDGKTKVSEGFTDEVGTVDLAVDADAWFDFPQPALLQFYDGDEMKGQCRIESHGVEGLYPDDVWILHLPLRD